MPAEGVVELGDKGTGAFDEVRIGELREIGSLRAESPGAPPILLDLGEACRTEDVADRAHCRGGEIRSDIAVLRDIGRGIRVGAEQVGVELREIGAEPQAEQAHVREVEIEVPAEDPDHGVLRTAHLVLGIDPEVDEAPEPAGEQPLLEGERPAEGARGVGKDLARVRPCVVRQHLAALPVDNP